MQATAVKANDRMIAGPGPVGVAGGRRADRGENPGADDGADAEHRQVERCEGALQGVLDDRLGFARDPIDALRPEQGTKLHSRRAPRVCCAWNPEAAALYARALEGVNHTPDTMLVACRSQDPEVNPQGMSRIDRRLRWRHSR